MEATTTYKFSMIITLIHPGFPSPSSKGINEILFATLEQARYFPTELNATCVTANSATLSTVNNV